MRQAFKDPLEAAKSSARSCGLLLPFVLPFSLFSLLDLSENDPLHVLKSMLKDMLIPVKLSGSTFYMPGIQITAAYLCSLHSQEA